MALLKTLLDQFFGREWDEDLSLETDNTDLISIIESLPAELWEAFIVVPGMICINPVFENQLLGHLKSSRGPIIPKMGYFQLLQFKESMESYGATYVRIDHVCLVFRKGKTDFSLFPKELSEYFMGKNPKMFRVPFAGVEPILDFLTNIFPRLCPTHSQIIIQKMNQYYQANNFELTLARYKDSVVSAISFNTGDHTHPVEFKLAPTFSPHKFIVTNLSDIYHDLWHTKFTV